MMLLMKMPVMVPAMMLMMMPVIMPVMIVILEHQVAVTGGGPSDRSDRPAAGGWKPPRWRCQDDRGDAKRSGRRLEPQVAVSGWGRKEDQKLGAGQDGVSGDGVYRSTFLRFVFVVS